MSELKMSKRRSQYDINIEVVNTSIQRSASYQIFKKEKDNKANSKLNMITQNQIVNQKSIKSFNTNNDMNRPPDCLARVLLKAKENKRNEDKLVLSYII